MWPDLHDRPHIKCCTNGSRSETERKHLQSHNHVMLKTKNCLYNNTIAAATLAKRARFMRVSCAILLVINLKYGHMRMRHSYIARFACSHRVLASCFLLGLLAFFAYFFSATFGPSAKRSNQQYSHLIHRPQRESLSLSINICTFFSGCVVWFMAVKSMKFQK